MLRTYDPESQRPPPLRVFKFIFLSFWKTYNNKTSSPCLLRRSKHGKINFMLEITTVTESYRLENAKWQCIIPRSWDAGSYHLNAAKLSICNAECEPEHFVSANPNILSI